MSSYFRMTAGARKMILNQVTAYFEHLELEADKAVQRAVEDFQVFKYLYNRLMPPEVYSEVIRIPSHIIPRPDFVTYTVIGTRTRPFTITIKVDGTDEYPLPWVNIMRRNNKEYTGTLPLMEVPTSSMEGFAEHRLELQKNIPAVVATIDHLTEIIKSNANTSKFIRRLLNHCKSVDDFLEVFPAGKIFLTDQQRVYFLDNVRNTRAGKILAQCGLTEEDSEMANSTLAKMRLFYE